MKRIYIINIFCGLLALIFLLCGVGVFLLNIVAPTPAEALESIDITEAEPLEYYVGNFLIVDVFAYTGDSVEEAEDFFCYALANDKYGNTQAVSISLTSEDVLFAKIKEYACNEEAEIGDLIIECAVRARKISSYPDYISEWYGESADMYNEMLGISANLPLNFSVFSEPDDFIEARKAAKRAPLITSTACTAVGFALAFAAFLIPGLTIGKAAEPTALPAEAETEKFSDETESNE